MSHILNLRAKSEHNNNTSFKVTPVRLIHIKNSSKTLYEAGWIENVELSRDILLLSQSTSVSTLYAKSVKAYNNLIAGKPI